MKPIKLSDLDKKVPFTVPEGYFDELTNSIHDKIHRKPRREWIPQGQLRWSMIAASLALLVTISWVFWPKDEVSAEQLLAQVSEQDLIAYLDFQELTEADLLDGISEDILEELWTEDEVLEDLDLKDMDLESILLEYENDINLQES